MSHLQYARKVPSIIMMIMQKLAWRGLRGTHVDYPLIPCSSLWNFIGCIEVGCVFLLATPWITHCACCFFRTCVHGCVEFPTFDQLPSGLQCSIHWQMPPINLWLIFKWCVFSILECCGFLHTCCQLFGWRQLCLVVAAARVLSILEGSVGWFHPWRYHDPWWYASSNSLTFPLCTHSAIQLACTAPRREHQPLLQRHLLSKPLMQSHAP